MTTIPPVKASSTTMEATRKSWMRLWAISCSSWSMVRTSPCRARSASRQAADDARGHRPHS